jgi:hypothetical protein
MKYISAPFDSQCVAPKSRKVESQQPPKQPPARYGGFFADLVAVFSFFEPSEWLFSGCLVAVAPFKPHNINDLTNALFRVQNGYDRQSNALSSNSLLDGRRRASLD